MESRQALKRVLDRKDTLALAFGAMVGWGWVILSGDWIGLRRHFCWPARPS
jgi:hypothetical protein